MTNFRRSHSLILLVFLLLFAFVAPARASGVAPGQPTLVSPADGAYVPSVAPTMTWNIPNDAEQDPLHFKVEFSAFPTLAGATPVESSNALYSALFTPAPPLTNGQSPTCSITVPAGAFTAFTDGGIVYWAVTANDGTSDGARSQIWSFRIDTTPPVITGASVTNGKSANRFSPDGDGREDTATIRYTLSETSAVQIRVYDATNNLVRTILPGTLRLPGARTEIWNGTDDSDAVPVGVLPDGAYRIQIDAIDLALNPSGSTNLTVHLDTVAPTVAAASPAFNWNPFSPNGDGKRETVTLTWTLDEESTNSVVILDATDTLVKTIANIPARTVGTHQSTWDGTDNLSLPAPDGAYRFILTCIDPAGNLGQATVAVTLDTTPPTGVPVTIAPDPFSPDLNSTALGVTLAERATMEVRITDINNVTVRDLLPPTRRNAGTYSDIWNGRNNSGQTLGSGTYTFHIKFTDDAENENTVTAQVRIDTVAPAVTIVGVTPDPFSPNGDGARDDTKISYNVTKESTVEVAIFSSTGVHVRTVEVALRQPSNYDATWDGRDALGATVADGRYGIRVNATDRAGNRATQATAEVTVDRTAPTITNVAVAPAVFSPNESPGLKDTCLLSYELSETSTVTIEVFTLGNVLVRTLVNAQEQDPGARSATWDGKNGAGAFVADGGYILRVRARDRAENAAAPVDAQTIVDNAKPTLTNLSVAPNPFAPDGDGLLDTTTVTYTLSDSSALCTVEVTVHLGALKIRDLLPPTPLATGVRQIVWNGRDNGAAFMDDGTYSVRLRATDEADNVSDLATIDVRIDKGPPRIQRVRYIDNRNGLITDDTIEVTFNKPVDDGSIVAAAVDARFLLGGVGTFGAGAQILTGRANNDAVVEIRMGGGAVRPVENADTLALRPGAVRSLTGVPSSDVAPRIIEDGTPPVLQGAAVYNDTGNDGLSAGDTLTLTFDEPVSVLSNSANGFRLHPAGNFGGGAIVQPGPAANKVVIILGQSPTLTVRGVYGVDAGATGIEIQPGGNTIVDASGNFAIPNPTGQPVDIASADTTGPKVVSAVWSDTATGAVNGGLSAGDEILVTFDKPVMVGGGSIADFKLPVAGDSFGAGATYAQRATKSVAITLGASAALTVRGAYRLGVHALGNASGLDVNGTPAGITDIGGNRAVETFAVDIGSSDTVAPVIVNAQVTGGMGLNLISPTVDLVTLQAIVDDASLKTGDVFCDLSELNLPAVAPLARIGNTTSFELGTTVVDITGTRTLRVWAVDYSGNTSATRIFTVRAVEPAASIIAEVNPSSVPKSSGTRLFRVHARPSFDAASKGIDALRVFIPVNAGNPAAGYQYASSLEVFVGGALLPADRYTAAFASSRLTVQFADRITQATANPLIELRFALVVPDTVDAPAGKILAVEIRQNEFPATYWQAAADGNVDGIAGNNNGRRVVVNDLGILSVATTLDYSQLLWRVNFEVVFNYPLDASTLPNVSFKPENAQTVRTEIPIQNLFFGNETVGGVPRAVFRGYARIPVDNPDYRNNFTLYARDFRDATGILIAEVTRANNPMAVGFVITAFSNPMDARDLVITLRSTAGVANPFSIEVVQPGDVPAIIPPTKIMTFRQILFQAVYRVNPVYPGQSVIRVKPIHVNPAPALPSLTFAAGSADADGAVALDLPGGARFRLPRGGAKAAAPALLIPGPSGVALGKESIERLFDERDWTPVADDLEIACGGEAFARPGTLTVPVAHIPAERRARLVFVRYGGDAPEAIPATVAGDAARAEIATPGRYGLFLDERAPDLSFVTASGGVAILAARDGGAGLSDAAVRVEVGRTVYTAEPAEGGLYHLDLSGRIPAGVHEAVARAVDRAGNASEPLRFALQVLPGATLDRVEAYPSPARAVVNFRYRLARAMETVTLTVYDAGNRRVLRRDLAGTQAIPIPHVEMWDLRDGRGRAVANGTYFFEITGRAAGRLHTAKGKFAVLR